MQGDRNLPKPYTLTSKPWTLNSEPYLWDNSELSLGCRDCLCGAWARKAPSLAAEFHNQARFLVLLSKVGRIALL